MGEISIRDQRLRAGCRGDQGVLQEQSKLLNEAGMRTFQPGLPIDLLYRAREKCNSRPDSGCGFGISRSLVLIADYAA